MFYVHPYLGKIPNLTNMFQVGWNHQPAGFFFAGYAVPAASIPSIPPFMKRRTEAAWSWGFKKFATQTICQAAKQALTLSHDKLAL